MFDRALEKRYLICSHDGPHWDCTTLRLCPLFSSLCQDDGGCWLVEKQSDGCLCVVFFIQYDVMHTEPDKL